MYLGKLARKCFTPSVRHRREFLPSVSARARALLYIRCVLFRRKKDFPVTRPGRFFFYVMVMEIERIENYNRTFRVICNAGG